MTYYYSQEQVRIKGNGIKNTTVSFDTQEQSNETDTLSDGTFSIVLDLERGENVLEYYAYNDFGSISQKRTLTLVIGEENYPDWLREQLGLDQEDQEEENPVDLIDTTPEQEEEQQEDSEEEQPITQEPPTETPNPPDQEVKDPIFAQLTKSISNLTKKTIKAISDVNVDKETAQTVGTIGYTAATASYVVLNFVTFTGTNSVSTLQLLSSFFMIGALKKKKKQKYGIVYDSVTKEPINMATVRVFNNSGKLVTTAVTDIYGVFDLDIEDGQYKLEVVSRNHSFPSKTVLTSNDLPYQNVYKGGVINYSSSDPLNISIPMDREDKGLIAKTLASGRGVFLTTINILLKVLFIVGFALTVITAVKEPTTFTYILLALYLISILVMLYLNNKEKKSYGKVQYVDGAPAKGIQMGLRELQFDTLYAKRITDENGKYRFILPEGKYRLESLDDRYVFVNLKENTFEVGEGKLYILNEDIVVKKVK
jgi:hypothetical protein